MAGASGVVGRGLWSLVERFLSSVRWGVCVGCVLANFGSISVDIGGIFVGVGRWSLVVGMFRKNSKKQARHAASASVARVFRVVSGIRNIGALKQCYLQKNFGGRELAVSVLCTWLCVSWLVSGVTRGVLVHLLEVLDILCPERKQGFISCEQ